MRVDSLERKIQALEAREAQRPWQPIIVLIFDRNADTLFVNNEAIQREPDECNKAFLARCQTIVGRSKKFVSIISSNPQPKGICP